MARRTLTVVVNPNKVDDLDEAKQIVVRACRRHDWEDAVWVQTTEDETGERQAREAVSDGADVVASLGGDGTVRAVGAGLVGTGVALGLLPAGTGNLLARNLGLPVDSLGDAVEAVLTGRDHRIDVGRIRFDDGNDNGNDNGNGDGSVDKDGEVFLVMAGLGLDGEIMAGTNEQLKSAVGWPAYVLSGAKGLFRPGFRVTVTAPGQRLSRQARMVLIGNCGTLQGGIELMPQARVDDGLLDAVVIAPGGAFGWLSVMADVVTRHRVGHRRLDRLRGREFVVEVEPRHAVAAEIDGDPMGDRRRFQVLVEPSSLVVRIA